MDLDDKTQAAIMALCDHLSDRTACLFLGAGINYGIVNPDGVRCPLGNDLAEMICRDLLASPGEKLNLSDAAEIARQKVGNAKLCDYVYRLLETFPVGSAQLALMQLPWDCIYTTNYDLLVERASKSQTIVPAGRIQQIFAATTDISRLTEEDIPYYKLHGSADHGNTPEGRLILTREDYRHYLKHRTKLFRRLKKDLLSRTLLFVGYGMADDNLREILDSCREELEVDALPLSYAIRPGSTPLEETFWREKYNIQLLQMDGAEFLVALKDSWQEQNRVTLPLVERQSKAYLTPDEFNRFQKVGESFYLVRAADCTGPANPQAYFKGSSPTWGDIRDRVPPPRDAYYHLMEAIFPELVDPSMKANAYLVTGPAGTGKTTLLRTAAFELANSYAIPILMHITGTPFDIRFIRPLIDTANPMRVVVIISHASESIVEIGYFLELLRHHKLPVTLLLEDRKNQWEAARQYLDTHFIGGEFETGSLSDEEIHEILLALAKYPGCLGKLEGLPLEEQIQHFEKLAHKELIVALRELTSDNNFDQIIRDEYNKVPSVLAQQAYVYVAALGRIELSIRYETLIHIMKLSVEDLVDEVLRASEGVLISCEAIGRNRHDIGFRLTARHPVIASVVFDSAVPNDDAKFEIINSILTNLDPGYHEDRQILNEAFRRKEFVGSFAAPEMKRAIFDRIEALLPNSPFVLQHRSILERDLGDAERAIRYARSSLKLEATNAAIMNTLGMALEFKARNSVDRFERDRLLQEAGALFEDGIRKEPRNPFGYLGKYFVLRHAVHGAGTTEERNIAKANVLSFLESAYELTDESNIIAKELAQARGDLGNVQEAIAILKLGLDRSPNETRLRDLYISLLIQQGDYTKAREVAIEGEKVDPTSWRLQRHIARLRRRAGEPVSGVKGSYEAAIRANKGNYSLYLELGSFLFMAGDYVGAKSVFTKANELPAQGYDKYKVREYWREADGTKAIFDGVVQRIRGGAGTAMAIPKNFEAFFWRGSKRLMALREGDSIRFTVGFNAKGAVAFIQY